MKKTNLLKYRNRLFLQAIVQTVVIFLAIALFLLIFVDGIWQDQLATSMYQMNPDLYYFFKEYKVIIILIMFVLVLFIIFYRTITHIIINIEPIVDSVDVIFNKSEEPIKLSNDFPEIEVKLNSVKYDILKTEQMAKEALNRKNDLIMYMAHDLKTPLTSVIGYLVLLNDEDKLSDRLRKKYAKITLDKAERLEELMNEFFEITRYNFSKMTIQKKPVSLKVLFQQLVDEFYPMMETKQLTCTLKVKDEMILEIDEQKMIRVFDNLIKNAIFYSYEKSTITIECEEYDHEYHLAFRNCGEPIPEEKLSHIFEKFYRLDSARMTNTGGAGLGLAIAKEIVEYHGGELTAESSKNYTELLIKLPK